MSSAASSVDFSLTELVPLALIIALSPLSIIPGILMLHTPRPRPTSIAFLVGWTLGILVITGGFVRGSELAGSLSNSPAWAPYVRIVLGSALIAFGIYRWLGRNRSAHNPKWLASMTSIGPGRAFVTGLGLTVANVKVFLMCVAAGLAIGTAALGRSQAWTSVVLFTVVAASTVALPVLAYLVAGNRLDAPLDKLKRWMEDNHAALVGVILVVIGAMVLYKGIHAL
ncbi:MAG: GAP family protein [Actinomycetia bacterium]|nr:GAP family protein [Actinomycetes bacterium]